MRNSEPSANTSLVPTPQTARRFLLLRWRRGTTTRSAARSAYPIQKKNMRTVPRHTTHQRSAGDAGAARLRRRTGRELQAHLSRPALRAAELSFEPTRFIAVTNDRRARAAQLTAR